MSLDDFVGDHTVVQLGREPQRIDLLTFISGVEFDDAWEHRAELVIAALAVPMIGCAELRKNELATGRLRDLADAEELAPDDARE